jgi:hypothetical protein
VKILERTSGDSYKALRNSSATVAWTSRDHFGRGAENIFDHVLLRWDNLEPSGVGNLRIILLRMQLCNTCRQLYNNSEDLR